MRSRRIVALLTILLGVAAAVPAGATVFTIGAQAVSFTGGSGVSIAATDPGDGVLNFTLSGNSIGPLTSPDMTVGGASWYVQLGTLTTNEKDGKINYDKNDSKSETDNLGLTIQFSVQGLGNFVLPASSMVAYVGDMNDGKSEPLTDVQIVYTGVYYDLNVGDGTILRAAILGGANEGSRASVVDYTLNDQDMIYWAQLDLVTPEPATFALIGAGLLGLGLLRRKRF